MHILIHIGVCVCAYIIVVYICLFDSLAVCLQPEGVSRELAKYSELLIDIQKNSFVYYLASKYVRIFCGAQLYCGRFLSTSASSPWSIIRKECNCN